MPTHRRALISALLILCSVAVGQVPAGNYTIDPALPASGTNFQTWGTVSAALAGGIVGTGNSVFSVASTTFMESVNFPSIPGTSAAATITFVAVGGPAIINAGGQLDGLVLSNAQGYLNFENIEIRGFTRYGLHLLGTTTARSVFCTFKRIIADAPASTSTSVHALRGYHAQDCTFEDCRFLGGGNTLRTEQILRNSFRRCEVDGKGVAVRLLAPYNANDADNLWENCFFHDCGPTGNGLHIDLSSYGNMFFHNTILVNTSGRAVFLGSLTAWGRANSFRNNVVVNIGTGTCMIYGAAAGSPGLLQCNDLNYNIYYAPNGAAVEMQSGVTPNFVSGSLATWQSFLAANPGIIPAAGGTDWDTNSLEGDPSLVSAVAPYDIRLTPASPCLNAGTSLYIAGAWITYNQTYTVADDFEGDLRPGFGVDIGADEVACASPEYETNGAGSSLNILGVQGSVCSPAITILAPLNAGMLNFASTNVGLGWEAALAIAPLIPVSGGAIVSSNGQFININFAAPAYIFLNGGAFPSLANPFPGNFSLGFTTPPGSLTASVQMVNLDPSHPDGFSASQGCQLTVP